MRQMKSKILLAALAVGLLAAASFSATASWQGTFNYYDEEGALVGQWTGGCGKANGRWGRVTDNKSFTQGCRSSW